MHQQSPESRHEIGSEARFPAKHHIARDGPCQAAVVNGEGLGALHSAAYRVEQEVVVGYRGSTHSIRGLKGELRIVDDDEQVVAHQVSGAEQPRTGLQVPLGR